MWYYEGRELTEAPEGYYGFIYIIEHNESAKKYVGRKYFTAAGYKSVKGKRKRIRKESDWRSYYGSSRLLLNDIEREGKEAFRRTIIRLCRTKGECSYWEAKHQFELNVLEHDHYYNDWITVKVHRSTVNKFQREYEKEETCITSTANQIALSATKQSLSLESKESPLQSPSLDETS